MSDGGAKKVSKAAKAGSKKPAPEEPKAAPAAASAPQEADSKKQSKPRKGSEAAKEQQPARKSSEANDKTAEAVKAPAEQQPAAKKSEKGSKKDDASAAAPAAASLPVVEEASSEKKGQSKKSKKEKADAPAAAAPAAESSDSGKAPKRESNADQAAPVATEQKKGGKQQKKKESNADQAPVAAAAAEEAAPQAKGGKQQKKKESNADQAPAAAAVAEEAAPPAKGGKQQKKKESNADQPAAADAAAGEGKQQGGKQQKKKKESNADQQQPSASAENGGQEKQDKPKKEKKEKGANKNAAAAPEGGADANANGADGEAAGKGGKDKKEKKPKGGGGAGGATDMSQPKYVQERIVIWDELVRRKSEEKKTENKKIVVELLGGRKEEAVAGVTTPLDVAQKIAVSLAKKAVISKVDGKLWDLFRPLEKDCRLEILDFTSKEGEYVFWHSSAHVLGEALELYYKDAKLTIGPPVESGGFYYDVFLGDRKVSPDDFPNIEAYVNKIIDDKQAFSRLDLSKEEALRLFGDNKFKVELIGSRIPDGGSCSAYRCGPLIDLCRGPHVPNTDRIKAFAVTKNSSAYWLGKDTNPTLQRVYGISFPDKKLLKEWQEVQAKASERDHRKIGEEQQLFFFDELSPGAAFFLPHGARIYNTLINFIRNEYKVRGFTEVVSPNVFNIELWKTSGHWDNYKENMFLFTCEDTQFGLKPMNCPGHCLMFRHGLRSYRELPIRMADFGVLHRNEYSGALTGLTRVRRFQQDDAHIFARRDQIEQEVEGALDFLKHVYGLFGFHFELWLSTRPKKYMGELELWDEAEDALARVLNRLGFVWNINAEDGAFYGPKIDIKIQDALKRWHQCATIQLDFQLPIKFKLSFKGQDGSKQTPVIIHRAVLGSVERMIAVLCEHFGGKWPFWVSPRQVMVVPVSEGSFEYARRVHAQLHTAGFYADVDLSNSQLPKKVFNAQDQQYNHIIVLGTNEERDGTVTLRLRGAGERDPQETLSLVDYLKRCADLKTSFR